MLPSQEEATVHAYLISLRELRPLYPLPVLVVNAFTKENDAIPPPTPVKRLGLYIPPLP
jgi:hypothetical protein